MSSNSSFIPLSLLISDIGINASDLSDFIGDSALLDRIGISNSKIVDSEHQTTALFTLVFSDNIVFHMPGLSDISLVFGADGEQSEFDIEIDLRSPLELRLINVEVALRFSSSILRPVVKIGERFAPDTSRNYMQVGVTGSIRTSADGISVDGFDTLSFGPIMIGNSGIVIEAPSFSFDVSTGSNIPQASAAGLPENWIGAYIGSATLYLPPDLSSILPSGISMRECFIGSGGFSGKVSGTWTPQLNSAKTEFTGNGAGDIFGIPFALKELSIEFKQNTLVESKIEGAMILPFFDQPVNCEVRLTNDGDFTVALSAEQDIPGEIPEGTTEEATAPKRGNDGLWVFTKKDLLELKLKSVQFKKEADLFSIQLGGDIKPLFGGLDWPEVNVKALTIDSKGHVKIDGGWLEIPKQKSLNFHGFTLEITKIGFGKEADDSRWIGLSGGISIVEGIPLKGGCGWP